MTDLELMSVKTGELASSPVRDERGPHVQRDQISKSWGNGYWKVFQKHVNFFHKWLEELCDIFNDIAHLETDIISKINSCLGDVSYAGIVLCN